MKTKPNRKYSENHCGGNKMEEGAVNAGYLCVSVEEAFLPVLLHAEGTSASVK